MGYPEMATSGRGNIMRRSLKWSIALAAAIGLIAPGSAIASQRFFVGEGDSHKTKVSFRLVDGEVKHGLVESSVSLESRIGPSRVTAFGGFRSAEVNSRDRFSCQIESTARTKIQSDYSFTFAGRISGQEATGRTSARAKNGIANFKTGRIGWQAEEVSKEEYEASLGIGGALGDHQGWPGCR